MKKELRQARIASLIKQQMIPNQEALLKALEEEGIKATQATVSRDIREMQIVKESDANGQTHYTLFQKSAQNPQEKVAELISELVVEVTTVQFMNVVKTTPRNANVLAALIDGVGIAGVVGTLAGYDTLVLISPDANAAQKIAAYFAKYMVEK